MMVKKNNRNRLVPNKRKERKVGKEKRKREAEAVVVNPKRLMVHQLKV